MGRHSRSRSRSHSRGRHERDSRSSSSSSFDDEGYRIHVADLGIDSSRKEIERTFEKFGPLVEVWMAKNPPCFAFVVYRHKEDADEAIQEMNGKVVSGCRVRCSPALPRSRGRRQRSFDPNLRCYSCGERGHFSRDCTEVWKHRRFGFRRSRSRSRSHDRRRSRSRDRRRSRSRERRRSRSPRRSRSRDRRGSRSDERRNSGYNDRRRSRSRSRDRKRSRSPSKERSRSPRERSASKERSKEKKSKSSRERRNSSRSKDEYTDRSPAHDHQTSTNGETSV